VPPVLALVISASMRATSHAASVAEGQLGHQLTAIPQARPQTNELHSVTLGQRNDGGGDAAH